MSRSVLILAHATDSGAGSVAARLMDRLGPGRVRVVRPESLSLAKWSHRVDRQGRANTYLVVPNQEPFEDRQIGAVFNRIRYLPVTRFQSASPKDREYAGAELQAVVASWLAGFGHRAVHPLRRHPWVTPLLPRQHWASVAAACRLPVALRILANSPRAHRWQSSRRQEGAGPPGGSVLVAGEQCAGVLASSYGGRCVLAAQKLGLPLLEFQFTINREGLAVAGIHALPPLDEPWSADLAAQLLVSLCQGAGA